MKVKILFSSLLMVSLLCACADNPTEFSPSGDIVNHTGTVRQMGTYYVIDDDVATGGRFAPSNLPQSFRNEGARVLFSGQRSEIPPNVRLSAIPLELTSIRAAL